MEENVYDEFGNYIGPDLKSHSDDASSQSDDDENSDTCSGVEEVIRTNHVPDEQHRGTGNSVDNTAGEIMSMNHKSYEESSIILHEDKKYYPDADEVYGEAEVLIMEEDAQPIEKPIIEPVKSKSFVLLENKEPKTKYSKDFLLSLMQHPSSIRNVAIIGSFSHGKTSLVDLLVEQTHEEEWDPEAEVRYTDMRLDEQQRKLSIKSTPVSIVLESSKGKSYLLNMLDCPGHINFSDETTAALQVSDGAVIVLDALEGVTMVSEFMIRQAAAAGVPIVLVINKIDRLIIELKLPPSDAYHKLMHLIQEVNSILLLCSTEPHVKTSRVSPDLGNVCFSSSLHGWCFSLQSFAKLYSRKYSGINAELFSKKLWGDNFYVPSCRSFQENAPYDGAKRAFVQFILEPIYKLYSQVLGESSQVLIRTLRRLGVVLSREQLNLNPRPLLKLVLSKFVGQSSGFVDMVSEFTKSPIESAHSKLSRIYVGDRDHVVSKAMESCDPSGPLMINIVKLYSSPDATTFDAFGRVFSGTVTMNQRVKILGESFTEEDDEDMVNGEIGSISISQGRYHVNVSHIGAGNWVLLQGISTSICNTATITNVRDTEGVAVFKALQFNTVATMKLAVEPLNPAELPKMLEGLRKICRSYPLTTTRVEESGEHIILCSGELAADCILHDLRKVYSKIEIKVADPVSCFSETVVETSSIQCFASTSNKKNKITMIAEPLEKGLARDIEVGNVSMNWEKKTIGDFFQTKYNWDLLAARSIWAFGPSLSGPNVLVDDTLAVEVDKSLLNGVKEHVIQGFKWGCREGPLCDEPIRNTKFKILDAVTAAESVHRGGGQIIPTARRVCYSSFLMATPRLMEPINALEIQCPADIVSSLYNVLSRRRGHISQDGPIPGSPLYCVRGFIPVIESFGFETDLRIFTQGQAFCTQLFDHWSVVPGDPLDRGISLRSLEPSPTLHLAREFTLKTRRRKGLSEDISIQKFFDDPLLLELAKQDDRFKNLV